VYPIGLNLRSIPAQGELLTTRMYDRVTQEINMSLRHVPSFIAQFLFSQCANSRLQQDFYGARCR
jgi:hypothetical protein